MQALVKADIKTGKVYNIPCESLKEARRFATKSLHPWRAVIVSEKSVECYESGALVSKESA